MLEGGILVGIVAVSAEDGHRTGLELSFMTLVKHIEVAFVHRKV
jgi:hypothetical protein